MSILAPILTCFLCANILIGLLLISAEFDPSASFMEVVAVYAVGWVLILGGGGICYVLFDRLNLLDDYKYEDPEI